MRTKPYCAHWRRRNVRTVQLSGRTVYVRWNGQQNTQPLTILYFEWLAERKWPRMTRRRLGKLSLLEVFYVSPRRWLDFFFTVVLSIFWANPPEERWIFETSLARFSTGNYGERRLTVFLYFQTILAAAALKTSPQRGNKKSRKKNFFPSLDLQLQQRKKSLFQKKSLAASNG